MHAWDTSVINLSSRFVCCQYLTTFFFLRICASCSAHRTPSPVRERERKYLYCKRWTITRKKKSWSLRNFVVEGAAIYWWSWGCRKIQRVTLFLEIMISFLGDMDCMNTQEQVSSFPECAHRNQIRLGVDRLRSSCNMRTIVTGWTIKSGLELTGLGVLLIFTRWTWRSLIRLMSQRYIQVKGYESRASAVSSRWPLPNLKLSMKYASGLMHICGSNLWRWFQVDRNLSWNTWEHVMEEIAARMSCMRFMLQEHWNQRHHVRVNRVLIIYVSRLRDCQFDLWARPLPTKFCHVNHRSN